MSTSTRSRQTGGASVFARPYRSVFQPLDESSVFGPSDQESPARDWFPAIDELLRIRNLEDDWDGEGTEAPSPGLVDRAITLAQSLRDLRMPPPDRVHASVNSTVYFEWDSPLAYTEIEVVSPGEAEWRMVHKASGTTEVRRLEAPDASEVRYVFPRP